MRPCNFRSPYATTAYNDYKWIGLSSWVLMDLLSYFWGIWFGWSMRRCEELSLLTRHPMLVQRNLIYTAITRGKRLVVVAGVKENRRVFGYSPRYTIDK
jgi:hypothetical protein